MTHPKVIKTAARIANMRENGSISFEGEAQLQSAPLGSITAVAENARPTINSFLIARTVCKANKNNTAGRSELSHVSGGGMAVERRSTGLCPLVSSRALLCHARWH